MMGLGQILDLLQKLQQFQVIVFARPMGDHHPHWKNVDPLLRSSIYLLLKNSAHTLEVVHKWICLLKFSLYKFHDMSGAFISRELHQALQGQLRVKCKMLAIDSWLGRERPTSKPCVYHRRERYLS